MCNAIDRLEVVEGKQRLAGGLGDVVSEQFHNGKHGQTAVLQFLGQLLDLLVTLKGTNTTKLREVTSAEVSGSLGWVLLEDGSLEPSHEQDELDPLGMYTKSMGRTIRKRMWIRTSRGRGRSPRRRYRWARQRISSHCLERYNQGI